MPDHLVVGILIGIASGIIALVIISAVTLHRLDSARPGETVRVHRALADLQRTFRQELAATGLREPLAGEMTRLSEVLAADAAGHAKDLRNELLESLKATLEAQLEQVRAAVDEKLESTVERRLGESFRLVSERLEIVSDRLDHVHRGLGEVQAFAARAPRRKPSRPAEEAS